MPPRRSNGGRDPTPGEICEPTTRGELPRCHLAVPHNRLCRRSLRRVLPRATAEADLEAIARDWVAAWRLHSRYSPEPLVADEWDPKAVKLHRSGHAPQKSRAAVSRCARDGSKHGGNTIPKG